MTQPLFLRLVQSKFLSLVVCSGLMLSIVPLLVRIQASPPMPGAGKETLCLCASVARHRSCSVSPAMRRIAAIFLAEPGHYAPVVITACSGRSEKALMFQGITPQDKERNMPCFLQMRKLQKASQTVVPDSSKSPDSLLLNRFPDNRTARFGASLSISSKCYEVFES
jgi:hypothetical protein